MVEPMSEITTHVLDAVLGKPAAGITVRLDQLSSSTWTAIASGATDADGRCRDLGHDLEAGTYRLTFATATYFNLHQRSSIYPEVAICFLVDGNGRYHIPLLLSDNSYTTYRGS
jgi:5-hydroxyisourate hydrolase